MIVRFISRSTAGMLMAVQFFALLGGGKKDGGWDGSGMSRARLAILPGRTHYNIISSPGLVSTVVAFLDAATR
jgi:hypothetical protein